MALELTGPRTEGKESRSFDMGVGSGAHEDWDRGGKFAHYRCIPSLRDYVLVGQREPMVEHHFRNADGTWTTRDLGPGNVLRLTGVEAEIAVDEIHRDPMAG